MDSIMDALIERLIHAWPFPAWAITTVAVISLVTFLAHLYITYSHGCLVGTLAIVEDPVPTAASQSPDVATDAATEVLSPYRDDPEGEPEADAGTYTEEEQLLMATKPVKPITSSIRDTHAHLERATGSRLARMRAFRIYWIYSMAATMIGGNIGALFGKNEFFVILGTIFAQVALAWLNMLWTHMMISKPRNLWFWKRGVFTKATRKILLPTFVWALSQAAVLGIIAGLGLVILPSAGAISDTKQSSLGKLLFILAARVGVIIFLSLFFVFAICLPATIVLVRCQAALLSQNETPIIPFDRTFGGRVGPDGTLSMRDAWTSFDWNARVRVGKVYLKTAALLVALWATYLATLLSLVLLVSHLGKKQEKS